MAHAQKPDLVFQRNGRVHLNWRGRQFSRLLAAEVVASAVVMVVMLDTPYFWGRVQDYWLPTPLACFSFTSSTVRHRVPSGFNWALLRTKSKSVLQTTRRCFSGEIVRFLSLWNMQIRYVRASKIQSKMLHQVVRVITTTSLKQNSASTWSRRFFSGLYTLSRRFIKLLHGRFSPHLLQFIIPSIQAFKAKHRQLPTASLNKPQNE